MARARGSARTAEARGPVLDRTGRALVAPAHDEVPGLDRLALQPGGRRDRQVDAGQTKGARAGERLEPGQDGGQPLAAEGAVEKEDRPRRQGVDERRRVTEDVEHTIEAQPRRRPRARGRMEGRLDLDPDGLGAR